MTLKTRVTGPIRTDFRTENAPSLAERLSAPLYVGWQLTNNCSLSCVHCLLESGPGKGWRDELFFEEALRIVDQVKALQVPYLSFSGGEPFLYPRFLDLVAALGGSGVSVKVETNGHFLTDKACASLAASGVKAVQVSLDAATPSAYRRMRPTGSFARVLSGMASVRRKGIDLEANFVPTRHNFMEVGRAADLAFREGASGFYTGRLIAAGNARAAGLELDDRQYGHFFAEVRRKALEYRGRMRVCYHELGILEEVRYRMANPAAMLIIVPNGKVKLINALPFVCADLRSTTLADAWRRFLKGWHAPAVARFVARAGREPSSLGRLTEWVEL